MLLVLAACGTASTTGSGTGSGVGQSATATTDPALSVPTTAAEATATAGSTNDADDDDSDANDDMNDDMGDMDDDADDSGTAVPTTAAAPAETATPAADAGVAAGASTQVEATLREWAIDLSVQEVAAGKVTFVVNNEGQFAHNLAVTDGSGTLAKTSTFRGSEGPQTLEVELQPGTYTLICDLPGHAQRGQSIELVVVATQ